jgi:putative oxidoreductase
MRDAAAVLPEESATGVASFDSLCQWLSRFPLSIIQLAGRVGVGAVFFKAGLLKFKSWDFTVLLFRDEFKVPLLDPAVAARIAMVQELTIPIFLFLGLATRLATLPLLGMILVIQTFVYPNAYQDHLVWGSILVLLLTRGPGVFSLDHLIERFVRSRHRPQNRIAMTDDLEKQTAGARAVHRPPRRTSSPSSRDTDRSPTSRD